MTLHAGERGRVIDEPRRVCDGVTDEECSPDCVTERSCELPRVDNDEPAKWCSHSIASGAGWVRHLLRIGLADPDSAVTASDRKWRSARQTLVIQGLNRLDTYIPRSVQAGDFLRRMCTRDEGAVSL